MQGINRTRDAATDKVAAAAKKAAAEKQERDARKAAAIAAAGEHLGCIHVHATSFLKLTCMIAPCFFV